MSAKKEKVTTEDIETTEDALTGELVDETIDESSLSDEATDETSADNEAETVEQQLEIALKKADENWDTLLRTRADMENLRRRNQKDVENAHKYGLEKLINEFLPIKESMELGLAVEDPTVESLHEGMQLTLNMFSSAFEKMSVE